MRKVEKILLILIFLSIVGKFFKIVGSGPVFTIATMTICILYFPLGFAVFSKVGLRKVFKQETYKQLKPVDIIIASLSGLIFQMLVMAMLFQIQYWPGGAVMSLIGMISIIPPIIISAFLLKTQNRIVYVGILKRGIPLTLFVLLLFLLPLTTKLKIFKVGNPEIEAQILRDAKENS